MPKTPSTALRALLTTYADLNHPSAQIEYLPHPPTPLEFLQIVSRNRPVIIRNAMTDWPAFSGDTKWTVDYLKQKMGDAEVLVAETPFGNADSIVEQDGVEYFVKPHTSSLPFPTFISSLLSSTPLSKPSKVLYAQSQDSNVSSEYSPLSSDIPATIPWASITLSQPAPDAVNVWIGNHHSVSSLHKDPYQNLYGIVLGTKVFELVSPLGVAGVREKKVRSATYCKDDTEGYDIVPDPIDESESTGEGENDGSITWPSVDLKAYFELCEGGGFKESLEDVDDNDPWKWTKLATPMKVEVKAGEMLYLPALWYHQVSQRVDEKEGVCVAVNYWYDMEFAGPFVSMVNYVRDTTKLVMEEEEARRQIDKQL